IKQTAADSDRKQQKADITADSDKHQQRVPNRGRRRAEADKYTFNKEVRTEVDKEQKQKYTDSIERSEQRYMKSRRNTYTDSAAENKQQIDGGRRNHLMHNEGKPNETRRMQSRM
ncbi:hypothetical protein Tco_0650630, partial [Tanacetum coccineum]